MKTSQRGIDLIKKFEGCKLQPYHCSAGVLTIGYGHTGADVRPGTVITQATAEELLRKDLAKFEEGVARLAKKTTQGQFDALVAFAFNLGLGALSSSTLLKMHNDGKYSEAAEQFHRWNKAAGKVLLGLIKRRAAESELYTS